MENKMEYEIKEETLVVLRTYWFYTIGEVNNNKQECSISKPKRWPPSTGPPLLFYEITYLFLFDNHQLSIIGPVKSNRIHGFYISFRLKTNYFIQSFQKLLLAFQIRTCPTTA